MKLLHSHLPSCLLIAAFSSLSSAGCAAQGTGKPHAIGVSDTTRGWVEVLGKAIVSHARHALPDAEVELRVGVKSEWLVEDASRMVKLIFNRKGAKKPAVSYLLSPWQRMHWRGTSARRPKLITVNKHAIVFGPIPQADGTDDPTEAADTIRRRASGIVAKFVGERWCNEGTKIGAWPKESLLAMDPESVAFEPIYGFRPYHLRVDHHIAFAHPYTGPFRWSSVVQDRLIVVMGHGPEKQFRIDCFPPAKIDRSRPRGFYPSEQRMAQDVDLEAAARQMDRAICKVFDDAMTRALAERVERRNGIVGVVREKRERIVADALPELTKAVLSYPGHTGPAHAAGEAALAVWRQRLSDLLIEETPWNGDGDFWPRSLISYAPELMQTLRLLPKAKPENLKSLRAEFDRYRLLAKKRHGHAATEVMTYSPTREELILAEIGDRIRTALVGAPRQSTKAETLHYSGFEFNVSHPLRGDRRLQAVGPLKVEVQWR